MSMRESPFGHYESINIPLRPSLPSYSCENNNDPSVLKSLATVNIFVGANNSGKSQFLRRLFAAKYDEFILKPNRTDELIGIVREMESDYKQFVNKIKIHHFPQNDSITKILDCDVTLFSVQIQLEKNAKTALNNIRDQMKGFVEQNERYTPDLRNIFRHFESLYNNYVSKLDALRKVDKIEIRKRYYVPVLRGMRPLVKEEDRYKNRTQDDYFGTDDTAIGGDGSVITGHDLYTDLKKKLLGEPDQRKEVHEYEEYLSQKFFQNKEVTLIPYIDGDTVAVKIGEEDQYPIYNLGDGLQNLIICTYKIFMEKQDSLFFLEEPDLYMHPSMQRTLLEVLLEENNHQYMLTTHSNHILDMTMDYEDISIFHFKKDSGKNPLFKIRCLLAPDTMVLQDLGVRNSSVLLANSTIWVEGITDRLYLRAFMKKYISEIKETDKERGKKLSNYTEDLHYAFVEYQGSNLPHWNFEANGSDTDEMAATRISGTAFVIADGDIANKGGRKEEFEKQLGNQFFVLECKEIENLLPEIILKNTAEKRLERYGKPTITVKESDYFKEDVRLGNYLDSLLPKTGCEYSFSAPSGTIKDKVNFCKKAVEFMESGDFEWTLTAPARDICEKIFVHIASNNGN